MRGGSQVVHSRQDRHDTGGYGQVLRFPGRRPDHATLAEATAQSSVSESDGESADNFARYEQEQDEPVDYQHRALMNVIALAIVTLLVTAGVWMADTLGRLQKDQDCVLQGRGNCAPIESPFNQQ